MFWPIVFLNIPMPMLINDMHRLLGRIQVDANLFNGQQQLILMPPTKKEIMKEPKCEVITDEEFSRPALV